MSEPSAEAKCAVGWSSELVALRAENERLIASYIRVVGLAGRLEQERDTFQREAAEAQEWRAKLRQSIIDLLAERERTRELREALEVAIAICGNNREISDLQPVVAMRMFLEDALRGEHAKALAILDRSQAEKAG